MKKKVLGFIGIFLILMFNVSSVFAISLTEAGNTVVQEGNYDSIRLVAGNNITDKANVDGISFVAGNDITAEGNSTYGAYAGNNINIKENILKDLFVVGNKIVITDDAVIGRDAFILGSDVTIMTNIARDLRVGANNVNISGVTINGDVYLLAENIVLDESTVIVGTLSYPKDAKISGLDVANVGNVVTTEKVDVNVKKTVTTSIKDIILNICAGIIVMLLLFYIRPKFKEKLDKVNLKFDAILKLVCIGFLILILIPMIFLVTVFTNVLTPLALILGSIYGISLYLGTLLSAYVIGNLLTSKALKVDNKYLALTIGIILVRVVKLIPYVGGFIGVICLLYGMGLITIYIKTRDM